MKVSNLVGSLRYSKVNTEKVNNYKPKGSMFGPNVCKHGIVMEGSRRVFIDGVNYCKACESGQ